MSRDWQQPELKPGRPLTIRAIVLGGALVSVVGAAAVVMLLHFYGGGTERDRAGLDVVRTTGTLVIGAGGAVALLLSARRQRSTELTLEYQLRVASVTERDNADQRITELYAHAIDQLGNEKAPVRLGGLRALKRLAQNNLDQRQTIIDVVCAYLRMPYTPPEDQPPAEEARAKEHARYEQRRQELQVRMTAQRILAAHLRSNVIDDFWGAIDLDLSGALLHMLDLTNCHIRKAQFDRAEFVGDAWFGGAQFSGDASFCGAQFSGIVLFSGTQFDGDVSFIGTQFDKSTLFGAAQFVGDYLDKSKLGDDAKFNGAQFGGSAAFGWTQFHKDVSFDQVQFGGDTSFESAQFGGAASFNATKFSRKVRFSGGRGRSGPDHSWPAGWTTREARLDEGEDEGWMYLVLSG